jgi:alkylated DNA nucleotide flippase Atl1
VIELQPTFPCGKALMKMGARPGDRVAVVQPKKVREVMDRVPPGRLITLKELCSVLAKDHDAMFCCTLTTGIQVMVAAQAARETNSGVPYWRTLKMEGALNEKYPDGIEGHRKLLEAEGYRVERKDGRWRVVGYEGCLIDKP